MILLLSVALAASVVLYRAAYKLSPGRRLLAAGVTFALLGIAPIVYVVFVGDQSPGDARLVTQEELQRAAQPKP